MNSHSLHGSESLCKLLRYLAEQALEHPGGPVKEYQIATEVFGRPAGFDPHVDSTVRVQAGRLRLKVAEYYSSEGAQDPIIVELPKGSYLLSFQHRSEARDAVRPLEVTPEPLPQAKPEEIQPEITIVTRASRFWKLAALGLSILLVAAIAAIGLLATRKSSTVVPPQPAPAAYRSFWKGFISGPEEPWVIFSNGAFVGRPETGMRYFNASRDNPTEQILDHYTGVGEVLAVHELDRVFASLHQSVRVKRGTLFSLDDAKNTDLIFVGSPAENLTLREIPSTRQFVFQQVPSGPRKDDLGILNVHPQPDEQKFFLASPAMHPTTEDYALIGLVPGLNPARSVLILAGTTTLGTQAAVEYVCRQDSLEDLLLRLTGSRTGEMKPFEAVLHVKVTRGVPVQTEIVAIRKGS